jgi:hypothetical protein
MEAEAHDEQRLMTQVLPVLDPSSFTPVELTGCITRAGITARTARKVRPQMPRR